MAKKKSDKKKEEGVEEVLEIESSPEEEVEVEKIKPISSEKKEIKGVVFAKRSFVLAGKISVKIRDKVNVDALSDEVKKILIENGVL